MSTCFKPDEIRVDFERIDSGGGMKVGMPHHFMTVTHISTGFQVKVSDQNTSQYRAREMAMMTLEILLHDLRMI
jgi:protein subunit release factor A